MLRCHAGDRTLSFTAKASNRQLKTLLSLQRPRSVALKLRTQPLSADFVAWLRRNRRWEFGLPSQDNRGKPGSPDCGVYLELLGSYLISDF